MNDPELERKLRSILWEAARLSDSLMDEAVTAILSISIPHDKLRENLRTILFKAAGGISDMAEEEIEAILQLLKDEGYEKVPKYPLPGPEIRISGK